MSTNGQDHEEQEVLPPNTLEMRTAGGNNINDNYNDNQEIELLEILTVARLFNINLWYARIFPSSLRRFIEFVLLLEAVLSLILLVYVHMNFSQMPANCLDHVKDVWPRDGILRVEIIRSSQRSHAEKTGTINELFTVEKSYEREYKLKRMDISEENSLLSNHFTKTNSPENKREVDTKPSTDELVENKSGETNTNLFNYLSFTNYMQFEVTIHSNYIVEYSLEDGFLFLSPSVRNRSSIPVMLVVLEPSQNKCYGNSVDQFFLEYFLGYDDFLLSSVQSLAENEQNKGFMRNLNTGESYAFKSIPMARPYSMIKALFIMIMFTLPVSMLIRYLQHNVYIILGNLYYYYGNLMGLPINQPLSSTVTPLLAFSLGLFFMRDTMTKMFENEITALGVLIIVCFADQYDSNFINCPVTKNNWPKFFYIYLFSFYAYHFQFNGMHSNLALACSWFFIQHIMVYFYHHYELEYALQLDLMLQRIDQYHQQLHHQDQQLRPTIDEGSVRPEGRRPIGGDHQASPAFQPDERTE